MSDKEKYDYAGYNTYLKEPARKLRKNMTEQEKRLWYCFLRDYPIKFFRQRPIDTYIADFYCFKARLVVEIDGSQHFSTDGKEHDENRTSVLEQRNIKVIRFSNSEINYDFEYVCEVIDKVVKERIEELSDLSVETNSPNPSDEAAPRQLP